MAKKSSFYSLLFAIFNDAIGWGIVLTIFAPLLFDVNDAILPRGTSNHVRNVILGILIGSYSFSQFVSMPFIGALSDHFGRKKILLITLWGAFFGFVLSGIAILLESIWLLFISRFLAGAFSGNTSIAQASIADMSTEKEKTKNISVVGIVGGISWILGPPIGGVLASSHFQDFGFSIPFWFVALLFLINVLWLQRSFIESMVKGSKEKHDWKQEVKDISKLSKIPRMSGCFWIALFFNLGWFFFSLFYPTFLVQQYGYDQMQVGLINGYMAIWWFLGSLALSRGIGQKFRPEVLMFMSMPIVALSIAVIAYSKSLVIWLLVLPIEGIAGSAVWIANLALLSNLAGKENQGKVFGINSSIISLALLITPIVSGFLAAYEVSLPLYIGAVFLILTGIFAVFFHRSHMKPIP